MESVKQLTNSSVIFQEYFYRPQTKFAKVMFSQVSVRPHGGGCQPLSPGVVCLLQPP